MPNYLQSLIGKTICEVERVHDYLQLRFQTGDRLNIFNTIMNHALQDGIRGQRIKSITQDVSAICIGLDNGESITVGMSDEDYKGPEAMEYIEVNGQRVVW